MSFGSTLLGVVVLLGFVALIAYFVTSKKDTPATPAAPAVTEPAEPAEEPTVAAEDLEPADLAQELRTSSRAFGSNATQRAAHNRGTLNSEQGWAAHANSAGSVWYQMDAGKKTTVYGVAIQGSRLSDEWVTSFTVDYNDNGTWKPVDKKATFVGNTDRDTIKKVMFAKPVTTRYIRIYPKTYTSHMSLRADLLVKEGGVIDTTNLKLLEIPGSQRKASTIHSAPFAADKGVLNSSSAWHAAGGADLSNQWYEFNLSGVTKVAGVAIQGRNHATAEQWITQFIVKYKKFSDDSSWKDVNGGQLMYGPGDNNSIVWVPFDAPIEASIIRIIPKAWSGYVTGRFDLLGLKNESTTETYVIRGYSSRDD